MGYLDNSTVTVEAILTKKGREVLARGGDFNITKFALSDDEIDYRLWQADHPLGSNYYGALIEGMPVLEASPDETQMMRYKLITLPKTTTRMPVLSLGFESVVLNGQGDTVNFTPITRYFTNDNNGYTAIIHNSSYAYLEIAEAVNDSVVPFVPVFLRDEELRQSVTAVGRTFKVIAKDVSSYVSNPLSGFVTTQLTVIGNDTGAVKTVTVRVNSNIQATALPAL